MKTQLQWKIMRIDFQRHQSTTISLSPIFRKKPNSKKTAWSKVFFLVLFSTSLPIDAATLVASYSFNDSLAANGASAPTLLSIDPLGLNQFETATVNGKSQRVFHWNGNGNNPAQNAGLTLGANRTCCLQQLCGGN